MTQYHIISPIKHPFSSLPLLLLNVARTLHALPLFCFVLCWGFYNVFEFTMKGISYIFYYHLRTRKKNIEINETDNTNKISICFFVPNFLKFINSCEMHQLINKNWQLWTVNHFTNISYFVEIILRNVICGSFFCCNKLFIFFSLLHNIYAN